MKSMMENEWLVVSLPESLTSATAMNLREFYTGKLKEGQSRFVIDASDLNFIDSVGIGILVAMLKESRARQGDVIIRNLKGHPYKVFKHARLDWVFTIQSGEDTYTPKGDMFPHVESLPLSMQYESRSQVGVFHLSGMMCYPEGVRKFKEEVLLALAEKKKILLNCKDLTFIDIQSVNEIFNIYFILKTSDGDLRLCELGGLTKQIMQQFGALALIAEYESVEKAIAKW